MKLVIKEDIESEFLDKRFNELNNRIVILENIIKTNNDLLKQLEKLLIENREFSITIDLGNRLSIFKDNHFWDDYNEETLEKSIEKFLEDFSKCNIKSTLQLHDYNIHEIK